MSSRTPAGAVRTQSATAKSENGYDALQRRVWKKVYAPNGSGGWNLAKTVVFTYDRWNVIMEKEYGSAGTLARTLRYTWGADVSGTLQGAGGVGGLLMAEEINGTTATPHYYCYDGNGNVTHILDVSGNLEASHRYTAFGGNLESVTTTAFAQRNPWRFSTKYLDQEVETTEGFYYYGYRFYLTALGRWPSRDPIGERGGSNLYGMVGNDVIGRWDQLGLKGGRKCTSEVIAGHGWYTPGSPLEDEMKDASKNQQRGDRCTAVGCFNGNINDRFPTSVKGGGNRRRDPRVPDYYSDYYDGDRDVTRPAWNPNQPGYLPQDEAYDALESKIEAAKQQAVADCKDKETCCKSITIKVNCMEGSPINFSNLMGRDKPVLCGKTYTLDCKSGTWE
ncbi:hypothetical protein BH11VER1_BH11VER1_35680 [soil metagenome]